MKKRISSIDRKTKETDIKLKLNIDGMGTYKIDTGIGFFDHMLELFTKHGMFNLSIKAKGDTKVDYHHTVEDVGLVFGDALSNALDRRKGIKRYGHAVTPMDDALAAVSVDLSNRPFLVYNAPEPAVSETGLSPSLAKEFFRALVNQAGMNLHINVPYGENEHHVIESVFKAFGRALDEASSFDERIAGVRSSKGIL